MFSLFLVVRIALVIQNLLVCLSALAIVFILFNKPGHIFVLRLCEAAIIILGSASNLASRTSTIAVERDWVVVVAADDLDFLAGLFGFTFCLNCQFTYRSMSIGNQV